MQKTNAVTPELAPRNYFRVKMQPVNLDTQEIRNKSPHKELAVRTSNSVFGYLQQLSEDDSDCVNNV